MPRYSLKYYATTHPSRTGIGTEDGWVLISIPTTDDSPNSQLVRKSSAPNARPMAKDLKVRVLRLPKLSLLFQL